jgi:hypothetical protein
MLNAEQLTMNNGNQALMAMVNLYARHPRERGDPEHGLLFKA